MPTPYPATVLLVSADSDAKGPTTLFFEPLGTDHVLAPGEQVRVESYMPVSDPIEVWHTADSITIYSDSARAWRKDGEELKL
jgi:hypothetical protein